MTGVRPRPPSMARGRYWHVRAYLRAVGAIALAAVFSHFVITWKAVVTFMRATGSNPIYYPQRAAELSAKYPVLTDAIGVPYVASLDDYLVRVLTYEPILAVLVGGLICTVIVENRQRRPKATR
ncbi:hypothetical protein [Halomicrobium salinisoli]|uniref:hypothetical protein n=1 Tax=Halomicrobium salinisoli TaxID=2878391 RepID=UPI001CEFDA5E|nr:hypothetical protein [Halomicrobium salinisoli]